VGSIRACSHQMRAHLERAGRGQQRPSSVSPPLQLTCASFLRQTCHRMHLLQMRLAVTTAQHLRVAHHLNRLPQSAVVRPSGGGGVRGQVACCDRQTVVHKFDFHIHTPPAEGGPMCFLLARDVLYRVRTDLRATLAPLHPRLSVALLAGGHALILIDGQGGCSEPVTPRAGRTRCAQPLSAANKRPRPSAGPAVTSPLGSRLAQTVVCTVR
jgi:hypothetical protein